MSGAPGTVVLAGATSGVLSVSSFVEAVPLSVSFSGVVTTTGVGEDRVLILVSFSFTGGGVLMITVGVSEMVVSVEMWVGTGVSTSVSVSFTGGGVLFVTTGVSGMVVPIELGVEVLTSVFVSFSGVVKKMRVVVVIGRVDTELVVIMKVCVIGMVLGVSLIVTTALVTR